MRGIGVVLTVVVILNAAVTGQSPQSLRTSPPRFDDYPVNEDWKGPAAPVILRTRSERLFKTRLAAASKERPDFAGHYIFAGWGCGSACAAGAIIDLVTGTVFPPPLGGHGTDDEYWIFVGGPIPKPYVEYHRNSRLMIVRTSGKRSGEMETHYLLWEKHHFRELKRIVENTYSTYPESTGTPEARQRSCRDLPPDEEAAIADLRTIYVANGTYWLTHGEQFGTMYDLVDNGFVDARFQCPAVTGYRFAVQLLDDHKDYQATAEPVNLSGRYFLMTRDGKIHFEDKRPASLTSPEVKFPR